MNEKEAANLIRRHNEWRRGAETEMVDVKLLGQALDMAANALSPIPGATRTVADYPDSDLVRRTVENAGLNRRRAPRWVHVRNSFGLGSTYAAQLCQRFGLDPDEEIGTNPNDED